MISLTSEQIEKVRLLDKMFDSLGIEQLRELSESEQIVARLKGTQENSNVLTKLINDNIQHSADLMNLRSELYTLKSDFQVLTKLMLKPFEYNAINDAQSLKSKYGIY
jgi:hypothetical protein